MDFRPVGDLLLKGKSRLVSAWQPNRIDDALSPLHLYNDAYQSMKDNPELATSEFARLHELYPEDTLVNFHFHRLSNNIGGVTVRLADK